MAQLALALTVALSVPTSWAAATSMACFGIFWPGEPKARHVIVPIAHFGMPPEMERLVAQLGATMQGPPRLVLETSPDPALASDGGPPISDVSPALREQLVHMLMRHEWVQKAGSPLYMVEALPVRLALAMASDNCLGQLGIGRPHITESRLRVLSDGAGWPVRYLESAAELTAALSQVPADRAAAAALSWAAHCDQHLTAMQTLISGIRQVSDVAFAQRRYRSAAFAHLAFAGFGEGYSRRDLLLRARIHALLRSEEPGALVFVGLDHVPDLSARRLDLPRGARIAEVCR